MSIGRVWLVTAVVLIGGCGSSSQKLPAACSSGPGVVMRALTKAPAAVSMNGTPISACFNRNADGTDVQIVGAGLLTAAEELHDSARQSKPGAALQLGYLIGAAERGNNHSGLGTELVRRMEAETDGLGKGQADYERGHRAGLSSG